MNIYQGGPTYVQPIGHVHVLVTDSVSKTQRDILEVTLASQFRLVAVQLGQPQTQL